MDMMALRRRIMMQNRSILPKEYQAIEYLQSSGTQYIEADYHPNYDNLSVEWDFAIIANSDFTSDNIMFGFNASTASQKRLYAELYRVNLGQWYSQCGASAYSNVKTTTKSYNTKYSASMSESSFIVDGVEYQPTGQRNNSFSNINFDIFAWDNNGTAQYLNKALRLYKLTMKNGNTVSANFVPCIRKFDSKPGMYETVSKTFYTNAGTGEFIIPT